MWCPEQRERALGSEDAAVGFGVTLHWLGRAMGRWDTQRAMSCMPQHQVCITQGDAKPRTALCLSFPAGGVLWMQAGWLGSGILAWERQALLFSPHDCLLLAPRTIRSSCSQ